MAFNIALPLRVLQALFSIIVMGLTAYLVSLYYVSPSYLNFLLFTSVWTILVVVYLTLAPMRFSGTVANHKYAILAAEAITMIFWFAAFIALADALNRIWWGGYYYVDNTRNRPWNCAVAADVFAAFTWVCFAVTTAISALHAWRTRGTSETRPDPKVEMHQQV